MDAHRLKKLMGFFFGIDKTCWPAGPSGTTAGMRALGKRQIGFWFTNIY
jgi:hypothetical protein